MLSLAPIYSEPSARASTENRSRFLFLPDFICNSSSRDKVIGKSTCIQMVIEGASKFDYKTCKLLFHRSLDAIYPLTLIARFAFVLR